MKYIRLILSMLGLELSTIAALFFLFLLESVPTFWLSMFSLTMALLSAVAIGGFLVDIINLYLEET